jgi:hypothetical protein
MYVYRAFVMFMLTHFLCTSRTRMTQRYFQSPRELRVRRNLPNTLFCCIIGPKTPQPTSGIRGHPDILARSPSDFHLSGLVVVSLWDSCHLKRIFFSWLALDGHPQNDFRSCTSSACSRCYIDLLYSCVTLTTNESFLAQYCGRRIYECASNHEGTRTLVPTTRVHFRVECGRGVQLWVRSTA